MRRAIVSGCTLIALTGACSSGEKFQGGPRVTTTTALGPIISSNPPPASVTTTEPGTDGTVPPDTVPGTVPPVGSLASLLITSVPDGFPQQIDTVADTGPTDLAKAAQDDNSTNARRALLVTGFVRGFQRLWTGVDSDSNDSQNFIFLYEFQSAKGAQGYADHWRITDVQNASGAAPTTFSPAYMPGSVGLRIQDKTGSTGVVIFSKGVYAVRAIVNGGSRANPAGAVTQLALKEYTLLP
jgi:hypothetical protein